MIFNSVVFVYYFLPSVICVFFLMKKSTRLQNIWLLATSFLFYGWCNTRVLLFLIIFGLVNYWFSRVIALCSENRKQTVKCLILTPAILLNLSSLFVVKYFNFAISSANRFFNSNLSQIDSLIAPLGISFLVFSMISYLVDIYRNRTQPLNDLIDFFLYLCFFPKVSQGPITRSEEFHGFLHTRDITLDQFCGGLRRFVLGLAKKVLIADTLGKSVDLIFANVSTGIPAMTSWAGMLCYTFQIYYDFSGYTDMAIGIAAIFGWRLPENFNSPYLSKSVSEFWRRWHITLGAWFREYVYIPLGGNRKGTIRTCINLAVVWLLTGIWHGAAYTYILWGIVIGSIVILEKLIGQTSWYKRIPSGIKWAGTFFVIMLSWVLFRSNGIGNALTYYLTMFGCNAVKNDIFGVRYFMDNGTLLALTIAIFFTIPLPKPIRKWSKDTSAALVLKNVLTIVILLVALLFMVNSTYSAFIYFQF